jgi:hypothetical protein
MLRNLFLAFGHEFVAHRQAQIREQARRSELIRSAKRARRTECAQAARWPPAAALRLQTLIRR